MEPSNLAGFPAAVREHEWKGRPAMAQQIRARVRWGLALGLAVGVAGAAAIEASGDDRAGRGATLLVAQKQPTKKKGAAKKGANANAAADGPGMDAATPAKADAAMPKGEPAATAADDGAPSFRRDIAPILVANCVGCHTGNGAGLRNGKLSMASFEKLMAGGKRGKDIVPGDAESSNLVVMAKGGDRDAGLPKMPPNNGQRGFAESAAEKIAAWVQAGARLDAGVSATDALDKYAPTADDLRKGELAKMKPEERDKVATAAGLERWKKATTVVPTVTPGAHFLAFGSLPADRTAKLLKAMESQYAQVNQVLGSSKGPALDPAEKIGLYVFKDQNSFVEFVRTVENQEVEPGETARARLNVESPYLVAVDPAGGGEEADRPAAKKGRSRKKADDSAGGPERSLVGLFAEQLVVAAANRAGKPPKWVALGLGAFMSSKVEGGSPYYGRLRAETLANIQIGWQAKATEVLGGQAPAENTRAVGFSLFEYMAANAPGPAMSAFLKVMLEGQGKLDDAINNCLGVNREQFIAGSGEWLAARGSGH